MNLLHTDGYRDFEDPTDEAIVWTTVCAQTGLLPGDECEHTAKVRLFRSDVPDETCDYHDIIEIEVCHPTESSETCYLATDACREFHDLTHSLEFISLLASGKLELSSKTAPNLIEMMELTTVMMENEQGKRPTLEEQREAAIEEAELEECPVHTAAALEELKRLIKAAKDKPEEPQPTEPSSETSPSEPPSEPTEHEGAWKPELPLIFRALLKKLFI